MPVYRSFCGGLILQPLFVGGLFYSLFLLMRKCMMILLLGKILSNIQRCRNKDNDTDGNVLCIGIHAQIL